MTRKEYQQTMEEVIRESLLTGAIFGMVFSAALACFIFWL